MFALSLIVRVNIVIKVMFALSLIVRALSPWQKEMKSNILLLGKIE